MRITHVEAGNRVQLPQEWVEELRLGTMAALDRTPDGILVRPYPAATWDEIYAEKLPVSASKTESDAVEISGDDLLF
jgi:hypothetical protein